MKYDFDEKAFEEETAKMLAVSKARRAEATARVDAFVLKHSGGVKAKKQSYVYILINDNRDMYKIGKTDNLNLRIETLMKYWGKFNLKDSFAIKCDRDYAFKLESLLQNLMTDNKYEFITDIDNSKDGFSEFFKIESLPLLIEFINGPLNSMKKGLSIINLD